VAETRPQRLIRRQTECGRRYQWGHETAPGLLANFKAPLRHKLRQTSGDALTFP
jgi:hypothetical protein